ncbi:hypothetical protein [Emcibacter nanhaiensis]|uniref:Uncharacterized protein n=1 Tax=Emcibacter nanhaiensis TaxID=1505037 RepID=A0A501PBS7_9PROT|nr:hypothetical protein [Emcibacter nanhaiensis]TPD57462.1 hypothetical protein FIV46_15185 [Emcibacter nanhaiensis]
MSIDAIMEYLRNPPDSIGPILLIPGVMIFMMTLRELGLHWKMEDISLRYLGRTLLSLLMTGVLLGGIFFLEVTYLLEKKELIPVQFILLFVVLMLCVPFILMLIRLPIASIGYLLHRMGDVGADNDAREIGTVNGAYQPHRKRVAPIWKRED